MLPVEDEKRIDIESKLAHQEHLLQELNDALSNQQAQISGLEHLCQSLVERIRALPEAGEGSGAEEQNPPHY